LGDVIWNNNVAFSVVPTDYKVHTATVVVTAVVGQNVLQFEGAGLLSGYGLTISNVALVKVGDLTKTSVLVNGNFYCLMQVLQFQCM